jgi:hypothetical protein
MSKDEDCEIELTYHDVFERGRKKGWDEALGYAAEIALNGPTGVYIAKLILSLKDSVK